MEHVCQQCGTAVEDGRPFCPHCRAPQISVKVAVAEVDPDLILNSSPDEPSSNVHGLGRPERVGAIADKMDSSVASRAALKAGVLGVFIAAIPVVGVMLTGGLAVFFYRRKSGFILPPALGARLGAAAGVVVFAISGLFTIAVMALHAQQQCIDSMMATLQRFGFSTTDPQVQASFHNIFTVSGQAVSFFGLVVFASIGGVIVSFIQRPKNPRD